MKHLVIIGAGGFGREALGIVRDIGAFHVVGFLDREPSLRGTAVDGCAVLGDDKILGNLLSQGTGCACVAIGDHQGRKRAVEACRQLGMELPNLIHPNAYLSSQTRLGYGNILYPGCVVMPGCAIGNGVLINAGVTIGHDASIADFCNLGPGARLAGRVTLREGAFVGMGACLREGITVSESAVIGAGSVVLNDVARNAMCYGVPARERSKPVAHE